ncbi:hypothetical protein QE152_g34978 [Popillia japonica]|uniref:Uncharacterized protein n=1 Tax=Popillia japonica TaxID=7064 RepID=A0AAW1ISW1_POPJA
MKLGETQRQGDRKEEENSLKWTCGGSGLYTKAQTRGELRSLDWFVIIRESNIDRKINILNEFLTTTRGELRSLDWFVIIRESNIDRKINILNEFLTTLFNVYDWFVIIRESNIDRKINILNEFLTTLFNVYAPLIEAKVTKARAPWLTRNLRVFMELRDRALSEFRISKSPQDWTGIDTNGFEIVHLIWLDRKRQEKRKCLDSAGRHSKKKLWSALKSLNERKCLDSAGRHSKKKLWSALKSLNVKSSSERTLPDDLSDVFGISGYFAGFTQSTNNNSNDLIDYYNSNDLNSDAVFQFKSATVEEGDLEQLSIVTDVSSAELQCSPLRIPIIDPSVKDGDGNELEKFTTERVPKLHPKKSTKHIINK